MKLRIRNRAAVFACVGLGSVLPASCGFATAGAVASAKGSGGGTTPALDVFTVTSPKESPCELVLAASGSVSVELFFDAGGGEASMTLEADPRVAGNRVQLGPEEARIRWDFDTDLGAGFTEGVNLVVRRGGAPISGGSLTLGIGNDAPELTLGRIDIDPVLGEAVGTTGIELFVEDSSADVISVVVEFDVLGDDPDLGWRLARPALTDPAVATPLEGIQDVQVSSTGTALTFFWDTDACAPSGPMEAQPCSSGLKDLEREVRVRLTPTDGFAVGATVISPIFRVDNNATPIVQLDSGPLILNPDERRGIPVPFRVIDEESQRVDVVFQWRQQGEAFPQLPRDVAQLKALLEDEELRREKHICTPYPRYAEGRVTVSGADTVHLPELASSESWILAQGLEGLTLELLRPAAVPLRIPLSSPFAAVPLAAGKALVLDGPASGRLLEVELESDALPREIARLERGVPLTLALEHGGAAALVALDDAGTQRLERVDLSSGYATSLWTSAGGPEIRGIASLGTSALVFTAGSSLFQVDYRAPLAPLADELLTGLAEPWGVAADPLRPHRIYVSEHGANRVLAIELDSRGMLRVVSNIEGMPAAVDAPEALALERGGARLLVVTGGSREIIGLDMGAAGHNDTFPIGEPSTSAVSHLSTGREGLRLVCVPAEGALLVLGGVEQTRTIASHSAGAVSVEIPFAPVPHPGQAWRIAAEESQALRASPQGTRATFLWDSGDTSSGLVSLRAIAYDDELSLPVEGAAPKPVRAGLDIEPLMLRSTTGTIDWPFAVVTADLDGDGDLDIASANLGGGHTGGEPNCVGADGDDLTVFFQDAAGVFGEPRALGGPGNPDGPRALVAADIDGNGLVDLVSANYCGGDLTVFYQEGAMPGEFSGPVTIGGAGETNGPAGIAAVDLDGDGDLDLVAANLDGNNLRIYEQRPGGSFLLSSTLGGPAKTPGPTAVVAADLDLDGDVDLAVANSRGDNLSVFFQQDGNFANEPIKLTSATMISPRSVAAADLDGDGDLDLVTANRRSNDLTVFFQLGPQSYGAPVRLGGTSITNQPFSVAAADLDADGDLDIVSANAASDSLAIFFQVAPGSFAQPPLSIGSPETTYSVASVAAADVDGDGDMDLVTANDDNVGAGNLSGPGNLTVFFQFSPGAFSGTPTPLGGLGETNVPNSISAADLDGDGDLDLASANWQRNELPVFFQESPGNFGARPVLIASAEMVNPSAVVAVDLDADGAVDLVSANPGPLDQRFLPTLRVLEPDCGSIGGDGVTVFFQTGPGEFAGAPLVLGDPARNEGPIAVAVADVDGNGFADVVSANYCGDDLSVHYQDDGGSRSFSVAVDVGGPGLTDGPRSVVAADLDGDGRIDLASANYEGDDLTVFFQKAEGGFESQRLGGAGLTGGPATLAAADLDGDGDLDLVSANSGSSELTVFLQDPRGSFPVLPDRTLGGPLLTNGVNWVTVGDLDRDGDADIASANSEGLDMTVFSQTSPGRFEQAPSVHESGGGAPASVLAVDVDGDGDVDLVLSNAGTISTRGNLQVFSGGR